MVLTDTDTTTTTPHFDATGRRLVNAEAGRIRFDACDRPYFANVTRGDGAWGNPVDAVAYAAQRAVAAEADHIVRVTDVETGEQWFVPVPARFITERSTITAGWNVVDTLDGHVPLVAVGQNAATASAVLWNVVTLETPFDLLGD